VVIEDRVWLGARAIVLKGVRIGHDAVIGAGAVVTSDVPPRSVAVGVPARVVRQF
jgi:acetyltransferase-like isoleucine patch superfamily enzyme